jgi:hypothetical protein
MGVRGPSWPVSQLSMDSAGARYLFLHSRTAVVDWRQWRIEQQAARRRIDPTKREEMSCHES